MVNTRHSSLSQPIPAVTCSSDASIFSLTSNDRSYSYVVIRHGGVDLVRIFYLTDSLNCQRSHSILPRCLPMSRFQFRRAMLALPISCSLCSSTLRLIITVLKVFLLCPHLHLILTFLFLYRIAGTYRSAVFSL